MKPISITIIQKMTKKMLQQNKLVMKGNKMIDSLYQAQISHQEDLNTPTFQPLLAQNAYRH